MASTLRPETTLRGSLAEARAPAAKRPDPTLPLVIKVDNLQTGASASQAFTRSPIRVGRSEINDLALIEPFVSQWHAVIQFDDEQVTYVDLGSLNGSAIAGQRVEKNAPVVLAPGAEVVIGFLRLSFSHRADAPRDVPRHATLFSMKAFSREPPAPTPVPKTTPTPAPAPLRTPPPALGPELRGEALRLLSTFAGAYLTKPESFASPQSLQAFLDRVADVLETFGRSFVELRKGYEEFGNQMGLGTQRMSNTLNNARDARQVLAYLLDPSASDPRTAEVQSGFADLMIHQVALLGAVVEGARAVLARLAPEAIAAELDANASGAGKLARGVRPLRDAALWRAYEARFHDLADEESSLSALLFGEAFARAYATIAGKQSSESTSVDS